ncbi:TPA: DUF1156 domain-containing protein [Legionella pneumophila]|nr:DUF1156 domain-containing protein [Legionella pneumophila]
MSKIKIPKKLIEVALPLDDINEQATREKSIRKGHPSTLHLWWARRPLATARAILFAQLVNDPGGDRGWYKGKTKKQADLERERLFEIIREMVKWENLNNEELLDRARQEIVKSWKETCELNEGKFGFDPDVLPEFHDPFSGGGTIPVEAQRLGLKPISTDLNPVAVTINKAMIEIPPRFANQPPIGPELENQKTIPIQDWKLATGLAEDVRRYAKVLSDKAFEAIGDYYPKLKVHESFGGEDATVIAWLWGRTVASPNPAAQGKHVPLVSTFWLCKKKGKEVYIKPMVDGLEYKFELHRGIPEKPEEIKSGTKSARGANFTCILTGSPITADYVKAEGKAGRMGWKLLGIVAEGKKGRLYAEATPEQEEIGLSAKPNWRPDFPLSTHPQYMSVTNYGPSVVADLFMDRQTLALNTFAEKLTEMHKLIHADALKAGMEDDNTTLNEGGYGATAYADAICIYLGLGISRLANRQSTNTFWENSAEKIQQVFARHALPMIWDTAEGNPFSSSSGNFYGQIEYLANSIATLPAEGKEGVAFQKDAQSADYKNQVISTDPPYYDNIPYADLSDFFYVWLRRSLKNFLPDTYSTMLVPKHEELVADQKRHGGRENAEKFFMKGMTDVMHQIAVNSHPAFPVTIYYAFRSSETNESGTSSTGWETFLEAVIRAGFVISGTWPVRTELTGNLKKNFNALASSIVLVCHRRETGSGTISRREFQRELRSQLPEALDAMMGGTLGQSVVKPVDIAQSAIGPGMAIYSKYEAVLNQDGTSMSVHDALKIINKTKDEILGGVGSEDADTGFCIDWFTSVGWSAGNFGDADILAQAKGTSLPRVNASGVIKSGSGKVRLLKWNEYPTDWDPKTDNHMPIWEACHHMIREMNQNGEDSAGALLARMPEKGEQIRQLAYHLYTLCERKKWAEEARAYNELIGSWHAIIAASHVVGHRGTQLGLELEF